MEWALAGIALAGFGFAATAVALAIRNGQLTADRSKLDVALAGTKLALDTSRAHITELESVAESRNERIAALYDELQTCGDPESRARIAVDGIRLMLPTFEAEAPRDPGAE